MWRKSLILILVIPIIFLGCQTQTQQTSSGRDWTYYIHTTGNPLNVDNVNDIMAEADSTHVFGIEVDNDIPGRYPSFLNPDQKLKAIKKMADAAHAKGNYAFVYVAGLECITPNADSSEHSFFKDHPDWVQRDIKGNPAKFGAADAFWIAKGDEDVWVSPFPPEWRKIYMKHIRQIAKTGIDGIYVDIPYWMTHFEGWGDTWASFDKYTVEKFKEETGLDATKDLKLGDFSDPNFRKWVDFRMKALTNFMKDIDKNIKSVNPKCKTIAEIYPGIDFEAVRVGADVYQMSPVVDVITHEYSAGGYTAADRKPFDWLRYMTGMFSFRAFAPNKPSWMLSYSWDDDAPVKIAEAMNTMFVSHLMAGLNTWDARGHVMSGSNDFKTRTAAYQWIEKNKHQFYDPRKPIHPIGVYFSPTTRNYFSNDYIPEFSGIMQMLLENHEEFQIVTPRTLDDFHGSVLILPNVKILNDKEVAWLNQYVSNGNKLVVTGETGSYTPDYAKRTPNPVLTLLQVQNTSKEAQSKQYLYYPQHIGAQFLKSTENEFNAAAKNGEYKSSNFYQSDKNFKDALHTQLNYNPTISVQGNPFTVAQIASVDGKPHVFLSNFTGIVAGKNARQIPADDIVLTFDKSLGNTVYFQEYLGDPERLNTQEKDGKTVCALPVFKKGAVVWIE